MQSLPRGAVLAAERAEGARSFAAGLWFPLGSRHEAPHERGFVHFIEHMAFKGTARRGAEELSRAVDRVGGYLNAFTDRDSICLHCLVPAGEWRLAIDVLADMAFCSTFSREDFEKEREVIVAEILSARDDPDERSHDELLARVWPGDPAALKIAGEPEDLRRADRDSLFDFYRRAFAPSALLAAAAGPVPPEDVATELAARIEALAPGGPPPFPTRPSVTPRFEPSRVYRSAPMEQVHYYEVVQLDPPFVEGDYYALSALNGAIGEASSSRLFQSLRERRGLCYSVYSAFSMEKSECLWMASANVSPDQLPELGKELGNELDAIAERGLTDRECEEASTRLAGSFEIALDDPDFRMRRLARQASFTGSILSEEETSSRLRAVGPGEIRDMSRRLLAGRDRARFAYGRKSARAAKALGLDRDDAPETPPEAVPEAALEEKDRG